MNDQEFHDLIYDMYYPDAARQEAAKLRYARLDREIRVSLLENVLQADMDGLVWRAVALLLYDDPTLHLPSILPLFNSRFPGVRFVVCAVLGDGRVSEAMPYLETLALNDTNGKVRYTAISALGMCGNVGTLKLLEKLLDSDDDDGEGRKLSAIAQESIDEINDRFGNTGSEQ